MPRRFYTALSPRNVAVLLLGFTLGGVLGYLLHSERVKSDATWGPVRTAIGQYRLVQPLLACDFPYDASDERMSKLKSQLEGDISTAYKKKDASAASVYLRTMNSGGVVGINENIAYDPASMVKVVLMMTYVRVAELHPDILTKQLTMTEELLVTPGTAEYYGTTTLVVGTSYRVADLIDTMIVNSDNGAKDLLLANIPPEELIRTLKDFGITLPKGNTEGLKMSPKELSLFFRSLFSATYLDPTHSEVALELLTRTSFMDGIVAGTPYGTQVAHKFGEYVLDPETEKGDTLELHDCGVVYAPGNPYFLCVMTRGSSHEKLASLITKISQDTYYEITAARP